MQSVLGRAAERLGLPAVVEVLQSTLVKTPIVLGYFRPVILLPLCVVTGLPGVQLELILAHELAHIRRHDYLVNLLQTLVETLFFYHPAVWWLSRQIRNERENCCDDVAMATVGSRADYGHALLAIEELRAAPTALSLAARGGSLVARIRRIAGCEPAPRVVGGGSILCVILAASIAIFAAVTWGAAPTTEKRDQASVATENRIEQSAAETVVSGQVVDSRGKPVAGAQVAVMGRSRTPSTDSLRLLGSTKADGEGRFRLTVPKLSSAAYVNATKAVAVADGFNLGWLPIGEDVESPIVTVSLTPEQTIHGRVVDANGKSAPDAKVYVTGIGRSLPGAFEGIQCWTPPSQLPFWPQPVTTDHEGRFTLRGVDRSQILNVQVRDDRFAIDWIQIGLKGEKDTHVTIGPSGEIILSPPPARIFEGTITYEDTHKPVVKARVEIGATLEVPSRCIMNMAGQTDTDGHFRLTPYSGKIFFVSVFPPDDEPYLSYQKEIRLADRQPPPKIEIALPRGVLLRGKITEKSSGEPVAEAAVKYLESWPPYRPDRIFPDFSPPAVRGISRADGTYQIAIPPGRGTLFVQGPRNDYIRQTINTWDFEKKAGWAQRHYINAYARLDLKPNQEPAKLNLAIRRGVAVRGSIVGPDNRPVGDVLMLSRHLFGVGEDTFGHGSSIVVKNGQFALHGLDPEVTASFYFLDPKNESGAFVEISGKSADNGPLVVHLQPCGIAVARFVTPQGRPKTGYKPDLEILVSPGPFRADEKRNKKEVSSDQDFVANFDREHYWEKPVTDGEGRCVFPSLIPGATYRIDLMNKLGDWDERDFTVKSGETLQLHDIVVPEPTKKADKSLEKPVKAATTIAKDTGAVATESSFVGHPHPAQRSLAVVAAVSVAEANAEQAKAIAEIKRLGGTVALDKQSPDKPVTFVLLSGPKVTDADLAVLKGLSRLQNLALCETQITDAGLKNLEGLKRLQMLSLINSKVTDAGLEYLKGLSQLRRLFLNGTQVAGTGLKYLEGLSQLQMLMLDESKATGVGLEHLRGLSQLHDLWLDNTPITDAGLEHIKGLTQLRWLNLQRTQITDAGLKYLKGLSQLEKLNLIGTKITNAGLEHIKGLGQLQLLALSDTQVTDAGLEYLKGLSRLQMLILDQSRITDAGLKPLKGLNQLHVLCISGSQVTDAGLEQLKRLSQLKSLDLGDTHVTDAGLEQLKGLSELQRLSLVNTRVTDTGLERLKGLSKLQWLDLTRTKVTDEGVKRLQQALPNCKIEIKTPLPTPTTTITFTNSSSPSARLWPATEIPKRASVSTAEANTEQAKAIAEIEKLGGKVAVDKKSPDKAVFCVILSHTQVTDAGLEHLQGLAKLESLFCGILR